MKHSIMIVDDHPMVRKSLSRLLIRGLRDVEIIEVDSGDEAIKKVSGTKPSVMLLDLRMPGMGGLEVCRIVHDKFPGIKIIILTLDEEQTYSDEAYNNGAVAYLNKTVCRETLLQEISSHLTGSVATGINAI